MNQLVETMNEKLRHRNVFKEKDLIRNVVDGLSRGDEIVLIKRNERLDTIDEHHYVCLGNTVKELAPMDTSDTDRGWTGLATGLDQCFLYTDVIVDLLVHKRKFIEDDCRAMEHHQTIHYRQIMDSMNPSNTLPLVVTMEYLFERGKVGLRHWVDSAWQFELNKHQGFKEAKNRTVLEQDLDDTLFLCRESKNNDRARAVYTIRHAAHALSWGNTEEATLSNGLHIMADRLARGDPLKDVIEIAQKEEPAMQEVLERAGEKAMEMYPQLDKGFETKKSHGKILAMRGGKVFVLVKQGVTEGIRRLTSSGN